jgi:hypothetical protein
MSDNEVRETKRTFDDPEFAKKAGSKSGAYAQFEDREKASEAGKTSRTHGMFAIQNRGTDAMLEPQRAKYSELVRQFRSEPGRQELREHIAARLMIMLDIGFDEIANRPNGKSIYEVPATKRMGIYLNALLRLLGPFSKSFDGQYTAELKKIREVIEGDGKPTSEGS